MAFITKTFNQIKKYYAGFLVLVIVTGFFTTLYFALSPVTIASNFDPLDVASPVKVDREVYSPGDTVFGLFDVTRRTDAPSTIYRSIACDTGFYPRDAIQVPPSKPLQGEKEVRNIESYGILELVTRQGELIDPGVCKIYFISEIEEVFGGTPFMYYEPYETESFIVE